MYDHLNWSISTSILGTVSLLNFSHSSGLPVSHCGFNSHFPNDSSCWATYVLTGICIASTEACLFKSFLHLKIWIVYLITELLEFLIYSRYQSFVWYMYCEYSDSVACLFIYLTMCFEIGNFCLPQGYEDFFPLISSAVNDPFWVKSYIWNEIKVEVHFSPFWMLHSSIIWFFFFFNVLSPLIYSGFFVKT